MLTIKTPTHFIRGINNYVPKMTGLAAVNTNMETILDFGTPVLAASAGIFSAQAVGATYLPANFLSTAGFPGGISADPWGREIVLVASGAATNVCVVTFEDYLGQLVKKNVTLNGTNPVPLGCAVKRIVSIVIPSGGASTVSCGWTDNLGLPYKASAIVSEFADGVKTGSNGTLTAPVLTDPATITSGDPRGLYDPQTTLDGVKRIHAQMLLNNYYNASGNGGYHGIRHYYA